MIPRPSLFSSRTLLRCPVPAGRLQRGVIQCKPLPARSPFLQRPLDTFRPYQSQFRPPDPLLLGPSRKVRFLRSVIWTFLFFTLGTLAALRYQFGAYARQSKVRVDSKADRQLAEEILDQISQHPAIQALNADPDFEEIFPLATPPELTNAIQANVPGRRVHHFIYTALRGSRGVFPRAFYCPSRNVLVMVVGFGYGTAGPLGELHNGAIATMVQESMGLLAQAWFPPEVDYELADLHMYVGIPLVANGIYCISVMPASTIANLESVINEHRSRQRTDPTRYAFSIWPDSFDPRDRRGSFNTMIARVSMYDGHPLDKANTTIVNCVGKFETEQSDTWPPLEQPQEEDAEYDT